MRLLLVEDEPKMASLLCSGLKDEGLLVDVAVNGREGVWAATEHAYDVLIIDVMLPDVDGFDVCRQIRSTDTSTPVLMLTARGAVRDRVSGLDAGADDYLVKPFAFDELLARLRALLRRGPVSRPTVLSVGDLHLDPVGRRVWRGEQEVVLTAQEFSLLQTLARRPGQVLSRQQLTHLAWDIAREEHSNIVDVCVRGLRNRVDRPFGRHSVQTVRGIGYRLSADGL
jgi:two-component system OmpR family response regulator